MQMILTEAKDGRKPKTGGQALYFNGTRFSRNGTDIDNRCGHEVSIADAIFE